MIEPGARPTRGRGRFAERSRVRRRPLPRAPAGSRSPRSVWARTSATRTRPRTRATRPASRPALGVGDQRLRQRDQLPRTEERARRRARAGDGPSRTAPRGADEVFVSTKGGYLPARRRTTRGPTRRYVTETFVSTGTRARGRDRAGLPLHRARLPAPTRSSAAARTWVSATIDLYYLHNVETQLGEVGAATFRQRLAAAIETLEEAAARRADRRVGTRDVGRPPRAAGASRAPVAGRPCSTLAREVAGDEHHFRGVQLPFNLAMGEALGFRSQKNGAERLPAARVRAGGRPRGVRLGIHPAGPPGGRASRGDREARFRRRRPPRSRRCSSPGRLRE